MQVDNSGKKKKREIDVYHDEAQRPCAENSKEEDYVPLRRAGGGEDRAGGTTSRRHGAGRVALEPGPGRDRRRSALGWRSGLGGGGARAQPAAHLRSGSGSAAAQSRGHSQRRPCGAEMECLHHRHKPTRPLEPSPGCSKSHPLWGQGGGAASCPFAEEGGLSATVSTSAPLSGPSTAPHLLPSLPTLPVPNTQGQGLGPIGRARASQSLGTGSCVHVGRAGTSLSPRLWETPRLGEGGAGTAI